MTKFCKEVFDEYAMHISQMLPLGLVNLCHFKYASLSLGYLLEKLMFRVFYMLAWKALFFYLRSSEHEGVVLEVGSIQCPGQGLEEIFFFIDATVIPEAMHWRVMASKEKVKDTTPEKARTMPCSRL
ncbi:hypothetical protein Hanom_Chr09g00780631 [Helianthus anomalus]